MPRGLFNWSERNVTDFLKENGFIFCEFRKGSHYAYINKEKNRIVEISKSDGYPPRTLETMIRQSGIDKNTWKKWASS